MTFFLRDHTYKHARFNIIQNPFDIAPIALLAIVYPLLHATITDRPIFDIPMAHWIRTNLKHTCFPAEFRPLYHLID